MSKRSGPFWDAVEGRAPMPRAAATLGLEFIDADVERGTIELAFTATESFTNPTGNVLGAFVAAMLYDTVGPALLATLKPLMQEYLATLESDQFQSTLALNVNFLRPVRPGRLIGRGRVVQREGNTAFLEASLRDSRGGARRDGGRDGSGDTLRAGSLRGVTAARSSRVTPVTAELGRTTRER